MSFRDIISDIDKECSDINNICTRITDLRDKIYSTNQDMFYFKLSKLMDNIDYKFGIFLDSLWSFSKSNEVQHSVLWNDNLVGLLIDLLENDESENILIPTIGTLGNLCTRKVNRLKIGERVCKIMFARQFYDDRVIEMVVPLLYNLSFEECLVVDWVRIPEFYNLMDRIMELGNSKNQNSKIVCRCFDIVKKRKLFVDDGIIPIKFLSYVRHSNFHGSIRYEVETLFNNRSS